MKTLHAALFNIEYHNTKITNHVMVSAITDEEQNGRQDGSDKKSSIRINPNLVIIIFN